MRVNFRSKRESELILVTTSKQAIPDDKGDTVWWWEKYRRRGYHETASSLMGKRVCWAIFLKVRLISAYLAASTLDHGKNPRVVVRKRQKNATALRILDSLSSQTLRMIAQTQRGGAADASQNDDFFDVRDNFGQKALEMHKVESDGPEYLEWIRLENELDPCLHDCMSSNAVLEQVESVRLKQCNFGCSDLYPRDWKMTRPENAETSRRSTVHDDSVTFSVAQFNTLAEGLASASETRKPFTVDSASPTCQQTSIEDYGGFSSAPHPSETLDFSKRKWRVLEVILGGGVASLEAAVFDLIGLQEVDRYYGFFEPVMRMFGYDGIFMPKKLSPCVRTGSYSDGCSLFWKAKSFALISKRRVDYQLGNQLCILASLRHRASGKVIVVAVTHLKAKRSEGNEETRKGQVLQLLSSIDVEVRKLTTSSAKSGQDAVPIIILGDFNSDPPSQLGLSVKSSIAQVLEHNICARACESAPSAQFPKQNYKYQSAYEMNDPSADFWTTWKIRGNKSTKRTIDYIFHGGSLNCTAVLDVPPAEMVEPSRLPGLRYPSDHLLIAARFRFV